jgi:uncharacterized protein (DUF2062 family)
MLFRQRHEPGSWERFKLWLWPRVSWRRSALYYVKRILRLAGTPYAIAMGAAVGAGVSFTPFIGFHVALTFLIAWLLRGNMIAGAIATSIGNPLTYPLIWASTYQLGHLILEREGGASPVRLDHELLHQSWDQLWPIIEPMGIGSIPLGFAVGFAVYFIVYKAVSAYRDSRSQRLAGRRPQLGAPAE